MHIIQQRPIREQLASVQREAEINELQKNSTLYATATVFQSVVSFVLIFRSSLRIYAYFYL